MGGCQPGFVTSASPLSGPKPVSATVNSFTTTYVVQFDQALTPGVLDPSNWSVRRANQIHQAITATAAGSQVSGTLALGTGNAGPDVVAFAPPPYDVVSAGTGLVAAAFETGYTIV